MRWELQRFGIMETSLDPINPDSDVVSMITNHGRVALEKIQQLEVTRAAVESRAA